MRERVYRDIYKGVQAKKSIRGMPWHQEPTKDVTSCEKLRGAANKPRSADIRMGQPSREHPREVHTESIGMYREPAELKHLSRQRKRDQTRFRE